MGTGSSSNRRAAPARRKPGRATPASRKRSRVAPAPRKRGTLSREQIARAAIELADREGADALTMRRLAGELGVGTMTLYGYFRNKEELQDAAVDVASREQPVDLPEGPWEEQLAALMRWLRSTLARHPSGVEFRRRRPLITPAAMLMTEAGMRTLLSAGFDPSTAARGFRTLFLYTFAFAAFNSPSSPEQVKREARATLMKLPPDVYPHVAAVVDEASETLAGDEQFEFGLRLLIGGLSAELERSSAAS